MPGRGPAAPPVPGGSAPRDGTERDPGRTRRHRDARPRGSGHRVPGRPRVCRQLALTPSLPLGHPGRHACRAPDPPGPASDVGYLTHRGARQNQERPQLLLEAGQKLAARPTTLGGGPGAAQLGQLYSLHAPGVLRRGSAEMASWRAQCRPHSSPRPRPPAARREPARSPGPRRARPLPGRDFGRLPCTPAPLWTRLLPGRQRLQKFWKHPESVQGAGPSEPRTPGLALALRLPAPGVSGSETCGQEGPRVLAPGRGRRPARGAG